ncbi:MAG: saccharopine dehydrogenase NADP-binding domain-containing protein [Deltaproteobacteria bacterium]|nr:saccharopine dehydrogenase NADP-binding domain-containing protein [Deltaproteobacteria bacterium]
MAEFTVLVLGAYGLAGRAIVQALAASGGLRVVASGRRAEKLDEQFAGNTNVERLVLDATDKAELRKAVASADVVINAIGPFARTGADIARTVLECGRHYVDCANEQIHYERLREMDVTARNAGLLLATGAGLIPGISTVLAAHQLETHQGADGVDIVYSQLRHAYEDSGMGSIMGGVLDAVYRPCSIRGGRRTPVTLGSASRTENLPEPFGRRTVLEIPNIEILALEARGGLREIRVWIDLGDYPKWLFGVIRALNPAKREWAYRLIDRIVEPLNRAEFQRAVKHGHGPDALVLVRTHAGGNSAQSIARFTDGATPTAVLPARIARDLAAGKVKRRGLATPIDLYTWPEILDDLAGCLVRLDVGSVATG